MTIPQTQVYRDTAKGIPGQKASQNPFVYDGNRLAEGKVTIGNFVWAGTDAELQAQATGSGVPIGLVERYIIYGDELLTSQGTLEVSEGSELNVVIKGELWVVASTVATVGQKVYATFADGSIATGSGDVETSWVVKSPGAIGEPIRISNWNA